MYFILRLSKLAGRYYRDLSQYDLEKCRNDTCVFDGDDCIVKALDFYINFKGEELKVKNRNVEYNLQVHAHNGIGFDTWNILNNRPCDKHIVDIIKNGKGIISSIIFNGYIQNNKEQSPQYLILRCGITHLKYS